MGQWLPKESTAITNPIECIHNLTEAIIGEAIDFAKFLVIRPINEYH
jgi:hypothetical protein